MSSLVPMDNQGLVRFIWRWYGPPTSPNAKLGKFAGVPEALVAWHEISAQWGGLITSHNYAIPLPELTVEDEKIPFWVENQGNWVWAFNPDESDCFVYEREPSDEQDLWNRTGERLWEFLLHATVLEAILGAPVAKVAQEVQADWLLSQEGSFEFPFPSWNWPAPGSRILFGENWLALVHPSVDSEVSSDITIAATRPEDLAWAVNVPGIQWNSYSATQDHTTDEPPPW